MKKILAFILTGILVMGTCTAVFAAPPTEPPTEITVTQDGKTHNVYVFGTALALAYTDGSIDISTMGPVGRVDVMLDGQVIKNVASVDVPAGQKTKMVLEEGSVIIQNVTAESGEAIRQQIDESYAAGATSVDLSAFTDVTAYMIAEDGQVKNAEGNTVSAAGLSVSVTSMESATKTFSEEIQTITAEEAERVAAEERAEAGARAAEEREERAVAEMVAQIIAEQQKSGSSVSQNKL